MDLGLAGKYALIIRGSHGLGRSTALALADEGCHIAICGRGRERIDLAVAEIRNKNVEALGLQADMTHPHDIQQVMKTIDTEWGRLHILVNNVGGGGRCGYGNDRGEYGRGVAGAVQ